MWICLDLLVIELLELRSEVTSQTDKGYAICNIQLCLTALLQLFFNISQESIKFWVFQAGHGGICL